ncbi:hypothetical protein OFO07_00210 [Campylobacter sp. JMF_06 NA1]|uniref:hypothetical protein n=1 Tax=Campylobacter sp. JMF_06 NA1 TaxID=2983823 RepID=UPI0022E9A734|nr:hypothetical protein [Campylobacter sp. JMF_06 NA1]MDA3077350.1 hypothetical protein [Campylobacter sp. JMF_06 NA1]
MEILILILFISIVSAILIKQIILTNTNKIIKFICILLVLIPLFVYIFPLIPMLIILVIIDKKMNKFNKKYLVVSALILLGLSAYDIAKFATFGYKCQISKSYYMEIIDKNYTNLDIENLRFSRVETNSNQNNFVGTFHHWNVYNKNNEEKVIAKIYDVYMKNFLLFRLFAEKGLFEGGDWTCGYKDYEIIDILKQNLINKNFNEKDKR